MNAFLAISLATVSNRRSVCKTRSKLIRKLLDMGEGGSLHRLPYGYQVTLRVVIRNLGSYSTSQLKDILDTLKRAGEYLDEVE